MLINMKEAVPEVIVDDFWDSLSFNLYNKKKPFLGKMEVPPTIYERNGFFVHSIYHGPTLLANGFRGGHSC